MGKIFYIIGKSATGKDTIYSRLLQRVPCLNICIMYSTRPMREGETDGVNYHFVNEDFINSCEADGRLIEKRTYTTVYGPWIYATVDDGQIDLSSKDYLISGTLESFLLTKAYFGDDRLVPLYIEVDDGERLLRAVRREMRQTVPKYTELCRRFLADDADFSEEKLAEAGITARYKNDDLESCLDSLCRVISAERSDSGAL